MDLPRTGQIILPGFFQVSRERVHALGPSFTGPVREFFLPVFFGDLMAPKAETMWIFGIMISWDVLYNALAVLIGAQKIGGTIGSIGHSLTGVSTLAVSSWVAHAFIIVGNRTMVYFMLIKPMQDMDV